VDVAEVKQAEAAPRAVTLENGDVCVEGKLQVGLSWDFFAGQAPCDLDTSALCFDNCGMLLDACFFNNLKVLSASSRADRRPCLSVVPCCATRL
jgi:stress response protein SCP2